MHHASEEKRTKVFSTLEVSLTHYITSLDWKQPSIASSILLTEIFRTIYEQREKAPSVNLLSRDLFVALLQGLGQVRLEVNGKINWEIVSLLRNLETFPDLFAALDPELTISISKGTSTVHRDVKSFLQKLRRKIEKNPIQTTSDEKVEVGTEDVQAIALVKIRNILCMLPGQHELAQLPWLRAYELGQCTYTSFQTSMMTNSISCHRKGCHDSYRRAQGSLHGISTGRKSHVP